MRRNLIGILSLLLFSFLVAVPASAVTLDVCGPNADGTSHFTLVAKTVIDLEGGNIPGQTIINQVPSLGDAGNLLVTNPTTGRVDVGPNVRVNGTVIARTINFPSNGTSRIANCVADIITGNPGMSGASCFPVANHPDDFTAFLTAHPNCVDSEVFSDTRCGPTPVANACTNTAPNLTVTAAQGPLTLPLTTGPNAGRTCWKNVNLNDGAVLILDPAFAFTFLTVLVQSGARLEGFPPFTAGTTQTVVNVTGGANSVQTEVGATLRNLRLNVLTSGNAVNIQNNSTLTNVLVNAPFGTCHPHSGTQLLECTEFCCFFDDIEPIKSECNEQPPLFCECQAGFQFVLQGTPPGFCGGIPDDSCLDLRACCRIEPGHPDSCAPNGG